MNFYQLVIDYSAVPKLGFGLYPLYYKEKGNAIAKANELMTYLIANVPTREPGMIIEGEMYTLKDPTDGNKTQLILKIFTHTFEDNEPTTT